MKQAAIAPDGAAVVMESVSKSFTRWQRRDAAARKEDAAGRECILQEKSVSDENEIPGKKGIPQGKSHGKSALEKNEISGKKGIPQEKSASEEKSIPRKKGIFGGRRMKDIFRQEKTVVTALNSEIGRAHV